MGILKLCLLSSFGGSLFFFLEAIFTDAVYSNCLYVNQGAIQVPDCMNDAGILWPLVGPVNHGYILGSLANSSGMGQVAGIAFLGMQVSFLALRYSKGWKKALLDTGISASLCYIGMAMLFAVFMPFCMVLPCRITNYIRDISYMQGLEGALVLFVVSWVGKLYTNHNYLYPKVKVEAK